MSWKRIAPSPLVRLRSGWRAGLWSIPVTLGIAGAVVTVAVQPVVIGIAFAVIVLVAVAVAWVKGRETLLPDALVDELGDEPRYRATYCTAAQLREACELTKPHYGDEYVPPDVAEQWRIRDPRAFVAMTNEEGELCACFGILALSPSFTEVFYKGQCTDTRLEAEDVLTSEQARSSNKLYLSGVVVKEAGTYKSSKRARVMLWALFDYYRRRFGFRRKRTLFGLAVTQGSERLLKTFGFRMVSDGSDRLDKCSLYDVQMSKDTWEKITAKVGDLSSICRVDWT